MTSIYMPSSSTSGGGSSELAGQVYGNTSNTIISTTAVINKQLTGLSSMTGAVTASDTILTGISKLSGNAGAATSDNIANTIVKRDGTGGFAAGTIKATSLEVSGSTKLGMPLKDYAGVTILNIVNDNTHVGKDISVAGTFNTAIGTSALKQVTADATLNTAVGVRSLEGLTTGTHNVAMGYRAGSVGIALTTGTKCTLIGADARTSSATMVNSTAIGYTAVVDADNCIQLGNPGVTAVKTSGTITAAAPTAGSHLTTKTYVDDKFTTLSNQNLKTTDDVLFNSVTTSNNVTAKAIMGIGLASGTFVAPTSQGAGISWNRGSTNGRTCFTNQQGGGAGGWEWMNYSNTNVPSANPQMTLDVAGNLAVIGGLSIGSGGNLTIGSGGNVIVSTNPTLTTHLTNKSYVDTRFTTLSNQNVKTTDTVTFNAINLPTLGTASPLNYYEEADHYTAFLGSFTTGNIFFKMIRMNKLVTMYSDGYFQGTSSSTTNLVATLGMSTRMLPKNDAHFVIRGRNGSADVILYMKIPSSSGYITIGDGQILNGPSTGWYSFCVSWMVA